MSCSVLFGSTCGVGLEGDAAGVDVHVVLFDVYVEGQVLVLEVGENGLPEVLKHAQMLERFMDLLLQLLLYALQQLLLLPQDQRPDCRKMMML